MPKPTGVADPRLQNIVENLYHGAGRTPMLGHGGTADAARIELATGVRIFGRDHAGNSAPQLMRALENWERRYGGAASAADRKIAQDLWGDLVNALAGF